MKLGCCLLSTSCLPQVAESAHKNADQLLLAYKIMKEAGYKYMECGVGIFLHGRVLKVTDRRGDYTHAIYDSRL